MDTKIQVVSRSYTHVFDKTGRNALTGATTRSNNLPGFYVAIT